jgi:hypothetical protein
VVRVAVELLDRRIDGSDAPPMLDAKRSGMTGWIDYASGPPCR